MAENGGIQLVDVFRYSGKRYLDLRQHAATLEELKETAETSIPDGFTKFCDETQCWYEWNSHNDETEETGKWRRSVPISEELTEEYIFAIVDSKDTLLFGIRHDGEVVYNKGMSDEVRLRLKQLEGIQPMSDENFIYAILDMSGRVLFGIRHDGTVTYDKGIPGEVQPVLRRLTRLVNENRAKINRNSELIEQVRERLSELDGYKLMEDEHFIFAITDKDEEHLLFGIDHYGRVVFDKGVPGEVQQRFDELKGYQVMRDETFLLAITDRAGRVLFGVENDGNLYMPKGSVQIMHWSEYEKITPHKDTLYVIQGKNGMTEGAYINGRALSAGEEFAFIADANLLIYRGRMTVLPKIWIDHDDMELKVEYPSNYTGPLFMADDGILFIV